MRPLILHNVPDDELYIGEDGIQRPYAMIWPENDRQRPLPRTRTRDLAESGSFGKSTRRSRSRTGSLPPKREDATMQGADRVFSNYIASQQRPSNDATSPQRKPSYLTQPGASSQDDSTSPAKSAIQKEPVEIILRGYASPSQQYAAINHYEQLAGRICEDYSREPPIEARRYKSDLRDPALTRRKPLSKTEREKVNKVASGEHWVKITFESQEAASAALFASPQKVLGHLVYAEQYHGRPPQSDGSILDTAGDAGMVDSIPKASALRRRQGRGSQARNSRSGSFAALVAAPSTERTTKTQQPHESPSNSLTSSQTVDTATASASSATASSATVTGAFLDTPGGEMDLDAAPAPSPVDSDHCQLIPQARRIKLLPAEAALAKQPSWTERLLLWIPLLSWINGTMIGSEVPRTELGEFDMAKASLYWQIMFYLDYYCNLFGHELVSGDKDD
ncbi:hypothetical protein F4780DRAFT_465374 [Xylariomycetidae sp. FL0641]|nr:hypothetical protein F4780DRAFT_465374 [Xylariomycetidae sp. FL0641]